MRSGSAIERHRGVASATPWLADLLDRSMECGNVTIGALLEIVAATNSWMALMGSSAGRGSNDRRREIGNHGCADFGPSRGDGQR